MNQKVGSVEIICGPMFAGKTEELIRLANRLDYARKNYLVFKPTIDTRYSEGEIVSHSNYRKKSLNVASSKEILPYISTFLDAIIIDEIQFFDEGIIKLIDDVANLGIRVIVGGLDMDFKGQPFPIVANLLTKAEHIRKLTAICPVCGQQATRSQRIINGKPAFEDDPIILVGASEAYEPRCRIHHEVLKRGK